MRAWLAAGVFALSACTTPTESVSTVEQSLVSIYPNPVSFPSTQVGNTSSPIWVYVYPYYENYDYITSITVNCPDFYVQPSLPAYVYHYCDYYDPYYGYCQSESYSDFSFPAYFKPTISGSVSCVATLQQGGYQVMLQGTGTLPPVKIDVQPGSLAFGDVRRNTSSTDATLTVRNLGGQNMTVSSATITGAGASAYVMTTAPATPYTVAPNTSKTYAINCTPATTGSKPATLVLASNDPATPNKSIPLSCNGIDSNIALTPSPAVFTTTRVGEPVQRTISIVNSGTATSTLQSVTVTGDMTLVSGPAANTVVPVAGAVNAVVGFAAGAKGDASGTLVVVHDGGQMRTAQLSATALATSMSMSPDGSVDFGPVCAGQMAQQTVTIRANDDGPFLVQQVGGATPPFSISASVPAQVQGNGANEVTFDVVVSPTEPGMQTGKATVQTDIPGTAPRELSLMVQGLAAGVTGAPDAVDFGPRPVDQTTIAQSVRLANCDASQINWSNARIEGKDAGEFAIVQEPMSATVESSGTATWLVVMQAKTRGLKEATFAVDHAGGTVTIALAGTGIAPTTGDDEGTGDPVSYYSCSAGGTSAWPVAFVLVLGVGRRRRRRART